MMGSERRFSAALQRHVGVVPRAVVGACSYTPHVVPHSFDSGLPLGKRNDLLHTSADDIVAPQHATKAASANV